MIRFSPVLKEFLRNTKSKVYGLDLGSKAWAKKNVLEISVLTPAFPPELRFGRPRGVFSPELCRGTSCGSSRRASSGWRSQIPSWTDAAPPPALLIRAWPTPSSTDSDPWPRSSGKFWFWSKYTSWGRGWTTWAMLAVKPKSVRATVRLVNKNAVAKQPRVRRRLALRAVVADAAAAPSPSTSGCGARATATDRIGFAFGEGTGGPQSDGG